VLQVAANANTLIHMQLRRTDQLARALPCWGGERGRRTVGLPGASNGCARWGDPVSDLVARKASGGTAGMWTALERCRSHLTTSGWYGLSLPAVSSEPLEAVRSDRRW